MPEHEVAKHTKVIYKAWRDPNKSWKHKLGEIAVEILIIVFAITLSLLVERWREDAHDQKIEQQFLLGLKKDLQADIAQMKEDSITYNNVEKGWDYFYRAGIGEIKLTQDGTTTYEWTLKNKTSFFPNSSRFEALKSSGELDVIEDDSLQNSILDLYQNKIEILQLSANRFAGIKDNQLMPYLLDNLNITNESDSISNLLILLQQPRMRNYLNLRSNINEVLERYHDAMQQSSNIILMINKQYGLK